jgi:ribosomal protein S18 acetylase RimI-like enzyme
MEIRPATLEDGPRLADLWAAAGLSFRREHVTHELAGALAQNPDLVLLGMEDGVVVASVFGTFDGRRGWVNRLATHPDWRGRGFARELLRSLEGRLGAAGCLKVNLLIEPDNAEVVPFYSRFGYELDDLVFMEKWL